MLTRREVIVSGTAAAILAGIGISPALAEPAHATTPVDRELRLAVSDGFARQSWTYAGQTWTETRDVMTFHEDETVRVTIVNDQRGDRVVSFGEGRDMLLVRQGQSRTIILKIENLQTFSIAVADQPMISRQATVRPNYGAHANVA
jgi:hypothetical protein